METDKQSKPKRTNKLFKFLPKAATAVTFQNPPYSPARDSKKRSSDTTNSRPRFSGPLSIIPKEARTRRRSGGSQTVETPALEEPTSPKVSCMGQIKQHRKKHVTTEAAPKKPPPAQVSMPEKKGLSRFFSIGKHKRSKKFDFDADVASQVPERAPALGHMRRFASSRDAFANFDWSAQIAPAEPNYQSDEECREQGGYDDEVRIPFSAPMAIGGGGCGGYSESEANLQPKKEINLWKRRTMAPPRPLQLQTLMN